MFKSILQHTNFTLIILLIIILLSSCFIIDKTLFNGIIAAKYLWVQGFSILATAYLTIKVFFSRNIQVKIPDIFIFSLCLWMIGREVFSSMPYTNPQKHILFIITYASIYLFFRNIGNDNRTIKTIIVFYLIIVTTQAIIGSLQLYGFQYSHHALFKITGTFHNPGPFSGFIVSGLPIALGLYLGTRKSRQPEVSSNQYSVISKQFWGDLRLGKVLSSEFWGQYNWNRILNYFSQFVIVVLLLVLPAARSRAAWLGGIVGCFYILFFIVGFKRFKTLGSKLLVLSSEFVGMGGKANNSNNTEHLLLNTDYSIVKPIFKKIARCLLVALILIISSYGLYKIKQGSADGRLLMWQVSWEMIKDKPIFGWGQGGFDANYANYQAEWFRSGRGTEEQGMVAGTPETPFNELIRVTVNYGLVGVILVLALLIVLFRKDSQRTTEVHGDSLCNSVLTSRFSVILKGGLISILVFSFFSYPLDVTPILVQLILIVSLVTNQSTVYRLLIIEYIFGKNQSQNIERSELKQSVNRRSQITYPLNFNFYRTDYRTLITKTTTAILLITIIPFTILDLKKYHSGLKHWQEAYQLYQFKVYEDSNEAYRLALEYLPNNGQLLQMKGKCLAMNQEDIEAINTILKAKNRMSNPIIYTVLGDCYSELGEYKKAEGAYLNASYMEPHKFYPQYLLAKLYNKSGKKEKAHKAIQVLLAKKVKISSSAITEMKDELKRLLQK